MLWTLHKAVSIILCFSLIATSIDASALTGLKHASDKLSAPSSPGNLESALSRSLSDREKKHQTLNAVLRNLFAYQASQSKKEKALKNESIKILKKLIPQLTINQNLKDNLLALVSLDTFNLFFLKPLFEEADFVDVGPDGSRIRTSFHWGHAGAEQNNIYLSSRWVDFMSVSERLSMIVTGMIYLIEGETDESKKIVQSAGNEIIHLYDSQFNCAGIKEAVNDYFLLKQSLYEAVQINDRELALAKYQELNNIVLSLSQLIVPVADRTLMFLLPDEENGIEESQKHALVKELRMITQQTYSPQMTEIINNIVDEIVNALYEKQSDRAFWKEKMIADTVPPSLANLLPRSFFETALLKSEKREELLACINMLSLVAQSSGFTDLRSGKVYSNPTPNALESGRNLFHEYIHYLGLHGQMLIDEKWEHITFGMGLVYKIMHACGGDIVKAEKGMNIFAYEFGPMVKALYQRGKELYQDPHFSFFNLKPETADNKGGYFSIDLLVLEAIKLYEQYGQDAEFLRRYLFYVKNPPKNDIQKSQFQWDSYETQKTAGMLLAGLFLSRYKEENIHPLTSLRDFFFQMDRVFGAPSAEDQKWVEITLIPLLEDLALNIYGKRTELIPGDALKTLGLWEFAADEFKARVHYWPFTLYPRCRGDTNRQPHREHARVKAIGNLNVAAFQYFYGRDEQLEKNHPEYFNHPAFDPLWNTLLIPRAILKGIQLVEDKIKRDANLSSFKNIPEHIRTVFMDKFNIGNPAAEKMVFDFYPLHLRYLDSLLYRWTMYNGSTLDDPRVPKGSHIDKAVLETMQDGWVDILLRANHTDDYAAIFEKIVKYIWPVYKELYEQAIEIEKNRQLISELKKEDKLPLGLWDPENLTDEEKEFLDRFFDSLAKAIQDAISDNAKKRIDNSAIGSLPNHAGLPSGSSIPAGTSGQKIPSLPQNLQNLVQQLSRTAQLLTRQTHDISQQAGKISQKSSNIGSRASAKPSSADLLNQMINDLQKSIASLGRKVQNFKNQADNIHAQAQSAQSSINQQGFPSSSPTTDNTAQTVSRASQMHAQYQTLQNDVNHLNDCARTLKRQLRQADTDDTGAQQTRSSMVKDANKISDTTSDMQGTTKKIIDGLDKLQQKLSGIPLPGPDSADSKEKCIEPIDTASQADSTNSEEPQKGETSKNADQAIPETGLQQIIDALNAKSEPSSGVDDETSPVRTQVDFDHTYVDEHELIDEMERTGLNKNELALYKQYCSLLKEDTIDEMIDVFKELIVPQVGIKRLREKRKGKLKRPVKAKLGGSGFETRHKQYPLPLKITFLIDTSGSMGQSERMLWVKLTVMLFLLAIFEVNKELETQGFDSIEFEIADFKNDSRTYISHLTSGEIGEDRTERLIYDALLKLGAGGGTRDKEAIVKYCSRLIESPVKKYNDKVRKVLCVLSDGDMVDISIKDVIEKAKEEKVNVLMIPAGDKESKQTMVQSAGKANVVDFKTLDDMPRETSRHFIKSIATPDEMRRLYKLLWSIAIFGPLIGLPQLLEPFIYNISRICLEITQKISNILTALPRETGYRHFFYEEKDGVDWLIWRRKDARNILYEKRFQRGAGGKYVPGIVTIDDDENEALILKIINQLHIKNTRYRSYASDGSYYIRCAPDKSALILMEHREDNTWIEKAQFPLKLNNNLIQPVQEKGLWVFRNDHMSWRIDNNKKLAIPHNGDTWQMISAEGFSLSTQVRLSSDKNRYYVWDPEKERVLILDESLTVLYDLSIDHFEKGDEYEGSIHRLIGLPGLGKDELIRAAAHLMNEEVFFIPGNEDLEPEDLREYGTLDETDSGHLYTALNHVQHNGGWCVIDERQEVSPRVQNVIKTETENKCHQRWVLMPDGKEKLVTLKNHERARIISTENSVNIKADQALVDRMEDIPFVWRKPDSEVNLLYALACRALDEFKPYRTDLTSPADFEKEKEFLLKTVQTLVQISTPLRLTYAGYNDKQRKELTKNNYQKWDTLLKDPSFRPEYKIGVNRRRAPSPRVLLNILEHMIRFPGTREHIPWSIFHMYCNFFPDRLKKKERQREEDSLKALVESIGGSSALKDESPVPYVVLKEGSFTYDSEYLIVTPEPVVNEQGQKIPCWDTIRLWLPPEARTGEIPEDIRYWLSTDDPVNSHLLYLILQAKALGNHQLFIGDQGSGKSFLAEAVAELTSGPEKEMIEVNEATDKEDLTFRPYFRNGRTGYDLAPVGRSIVKGKTCIIEEGTQVRPGVMSVINEAMERKFLSQADGSILEGATKEIKNAFTLLLPCNQPGEGNFDVSEFRDAFKERCAGFWFDPLTPERLYQFLLVFARRGDYSLNQRIIGQKTLKPGSLAEYEQYEGEDKFFGLVGIVQYIKHAMAKDPAFMPRAPGLRPLKKIIKHMRENWDDEAAFSSLSLQELLLQYFRDSFVMEGDLKKREKWNNNLKEAFSYAGLWDANKDAVKKYLNQEDMVVQCLPIIREPQTTDPLLNASLIYIQQNTRGIGVSQHLKAVEEKAKKLLATADKWKNITFFDRLQRIYDVREIWQILRLIRDKRTGDPSQITQYGNKDREHVIRIMTSVIQARLFEEDWPETFIIKGADLDESPESLEVLRNTCPATMPTADNEVDDILGKIALNIENEKYVLQQVSNIEKIYVFLGRPFEIPKHKNLKRYIFTKCSFDYFEALENKISSDNVRNCLLAFKEKLQKDLDLLAWPQDLQASLIDVGRKQLDEKEAFIKTIYDINKLPGLYACYDDLLILAYTNRNIVNKFDNLFETIFQQIQMLENAKEKIKKLKEYIFGADKEFPVRHGPAYKLLADIYKSSEPEEKLKLIQSRNHQHIENIHQQQEKKDDYLPLIKGCIKEFIEILSHRIDILNDWGEREAMNLINQFRELEGMDVIVTDEIQRQISVLRHRIAQHEARIKEIETAIQQQAAQQQAAQQKGEYIGDNKWKKLSRSSLRKLIKKDFGNSWIYCFTFYSYQDAQGEEYEVLAAGGGNGILSINQQKIQKKLDDVSLKEIEQEIQKLQKEKKQREKEIKILIAKIKKLREKQRKPQQNTLIKKTIKFLPLILIPIFAIVEMFYNNVHEQVDGRSMFQTAGINPSVLHNLCDWLAFSLFFIIPQDIYNVMAKIIDRFLSVKRSEIPTIIIPSAVPQQSPLRDVDSLCTSS